MAFPWIQLLLDGSFLTRRRISSLNCEVRSWLKKSEVAAVSSQAWTVPGWLQVSGGNCFSDVCSPTLRVPEGLLGRLQGHAWTTQGGIVSLYTCLQVVLTAFHEVIVRRSSSASPSFISHHSECYLPLMWKVLEQGWITPGSALCHFERQSL